MKNNIYFAVFLYIFIIVVLIVWKPDFLYDDERKQFKKFGYSKKETIMPIEFIALGLPVLIMFLKSKGCENNISMGMNGGGMQYVPIQYMPIQYMPVPMQPVMQQIVKN